MKDNSAVKMTATLIYTASVPNLLTSTSREHSLDFLRMACSSLANFNQSKLEFAAGILFWD